MNNSSYEKYKDNLIKSIKEFEDFNNYLLKDLSKDMKLLDKIKVQNYLDILKNKFDTIIYDISTINEKFIEDLAKRSTDVSE